MPKQVTITPEVRAVLERGEWKGWLFVLPDGQLDRPLYDAVNKVLVALGGKWNRAQRGHMFSLDAKPTMVAALESGVAVDQARTAEQFFTPPVVAETLVYRARIEGVQRVLEPSAGAGALIAASARRHPEAIIDAVERDPALVGLLRREWRLRVLVTEADFLAWGPPGSRRYDRVVMNPPFSKGADMAHVRRALGFLRPGGILVAIMSPHWTFATSDAAQRFRGLVNDHSHDWEPLPEGSFKQAGTGVSTGILTIRKGD